MDRTSGAGRGLDALGPRPTVDGSAEEEDALPSPTVGRYLCVLFELSALGKSPVATGAVARSLAVEPATVTETFERLAARGYVQYEPYRGATLTDTGERIARDLTWRRCVLRTFFERTLEAPLPEGAAYRSGYALPAPALQALADWLERPCGDRRDRAADPA
jgi:Mn-dependent DtxR family transcriptional regulator